jgi:hypothetical protein
MYGLAVLHENVQTGLFGAALPPAPTKLYRPCNLIEIVAATAS